MGNGLRKDEWEAIIQQHGGDTKGFSVSADPRIAEDWASIQAALRGKTHGMVLEAEVDQLPTLYSDPLHADPNEFFIEPDDFPLIAPGVSRPHGGPVPPLGGSLPGPKP
jgi:hypothetical protein